MRIFIGILLTFHIFIGCTNRKTSIDIFFEKLDSSFSYSEKNEIRKCANLDCLKSFAYEIHHTNI